MLEFAKGYPDVGRALPEVEKEVLKLPRQYVANIIYTLVGMAFKRWVGARVDARHKKVAEDKNLNIAMDPEIAAIYRASMAVSVSKGTSHNLMKITAKRRRSKAQIAEEKEAEKRRLVEVDQKLMQLNHLQNQMPGLQDKAERHDVLLDTVQGLIEKGLVKHLDDGTIEAVQSFQEHQQVLQEKAQMSQSVNQSQAA
jgi:hypothetical protein